jgi:hypothetical protein
LGHDTFLKNSSITHAPYDNIDKVIPTDTSNPPLSKAAKKFLPDPSLNPTLPPPQPQDPGASGKKKSSHHDPSQP